MSLLSKRKILRALYPLIRKIGRAGKNGTILVNTKRIEPPTPFYTQTAVLNNGQRLDFSEYAGKKILLVNTASDCGYTGQYAELQSLHEKLGDNLVIIAFPANDFKEQEKASDTDIASFCQRNYGVSFPIAQKGVVIKNGSQQPVFQWLTQRERNGWCDHQPDWNFSKYLINEKGTLSHYFGPSISPLEPTVLDAVKAKT